ncbi:MAG: hypothetical protein BGO99_13820 [Nitrosospira sp. 56-18]|nr:hypothetical protein [Nitrosospira sp.]OJY12448.1 MAG: hypothetical protein BGO99_13820 [Nitrosospira sp. 56-18]
MRSQYGDWYGDWFMNKVRGSIMNNGPLPGDDPSLIAKRRLTLQQGGKQKRRNEIRLALALGQGGQSRNEKRLSLAL